VTKPKGMGKISYNNPKGYLTKIVESKKGENKNEFSLVSEENKKRNHFLPTRQNYWPRKNGP